MLLYVDEIFYVRFDWEVDDDGELNGLSLLEAGVLLELFVYTGFLVIIQFDMIF